MTREIKFRVYDFDRKEMCHDINIGFDTWGNTLVEPDFGESKPFLKIYKNYVSNFVVMQYTGLKDKNGKEIYEGDIVRIKNMDSGVDESGHTWREGDYVEQIRFSNGIFGIGRRGCLITFQKLCRIEQVEVIGNIYENPELIEGQ